MKTKIKTKIKINALVILISFFCLSFSVKAQEPTSPTNIADDQTQELLEETMATGEAGNSEGTLVATVNIYDAQIVEQKNNEFRVSFELSNREIVQPGIVYAIQLTRGGVLIDEEVYPEKIDLGENQTIKKEVNYLAPEQFNGGFELGVVARNIGGLPLAFVDLGIVQLEGTNQYVEILPESCILKVDGEAEDKKYFADQGIDVKSEETLIAYCAIMNHSNVLQKIIPRVTTNRQSVSGDKIETKIDEPLVLEIKPLETKLLHFIFPKASKPQAYDAILELLNQQGQAVSNQANFHYVLRGQSATIRNIRLDKDYYAKGETAKVSFFWTGSADNFPDSRLGRTEEGKKFVDILIKNSEGKVCGNFQKELSAKEAIDSFEVGMNENCHNPEILVAIKDDKNNILDEQIFSVKSQKLNAESKKAPTTQSKTKAEKNSILLKIVGLLTVLSFLVITFWKVFRKKQGLMIFLIFLVSIAIFNSNIKTVHADTAAGFWSNWWTFTYNLDKSVYKPGEKMTATGRVYYAYCLNHIATVNNMLFNNMVNSGNVDMKYSVYVYSYTTAPDCTDYGCYGGYTYYTVSDAPRQDLINAGWSLDKHSSNKTRYTGFTIYSERTSPLFKARVNAPAAGGNYSGRFALRIGWESTWPTYFFNFPYTVSCTPNCNAASSHCLGTKFADSCGTANACTGTKTNGACCVPNCNNASNHCLGTKFANSCGTANACTGTKTDGVCCVPSSWTPDPSTVCSGTSFTQASDCSTTQVVLGTKSPSYDCAEPSCAGKCGPVSKTCLSSCGFNCSTVNCGDYDCPSCNNGTWKEVTP